MTRSFFFTLFILIAAVSFCQLPKKDTVNAVGFFNNENKAQVLLIIRHRKNDGIGGTSYMKAVKIINVVSRKIEAIKKYNTWERY